MLTDKDIQKLAKIFPTKDEAVLKNDFKKLRQDFRSLQTSNEFYINKDGL